MNLDLFKPIRLSEMSQVKLMNRSDHKFWFSYELLHDMLRCIKNDYYILSINNQVLLPYKTTYYDTLKNDMYVAHHNGKLNRYKIRRRSYIINDISFLEVNPHCVKKLRKKEKTVDNLVIYQQFKLFDFVLSSISAT
jgi:hypothetical protein